jgi:predicted flap endonuclease-1-like 5' DNA nuclease
MFNAAHILETALIMLAAFLIGAVAGTLIRSALRRKPAAPVSPAVVVPAAAGPALVTAPVIDPILAPAVPVASEDVPVPDFAETMIALASAPLPEIRQMPAIAPLPAVEGAAPVALVKALIEPARAAGETTSGRHIASPLDEAQPKTPVTSETTQSADILPFPIEVTAAPSLTDVAAELESLLTLAVAADAEAPKPDHPPTEQPENAAPVPAVVEYSPSVLAAVVTEESASATLDAVPDTLFVESEAAGVDGGLAVPEISEAAEITEPDAEIAKFDAEIAKSEVVAPADAVPEAVAQAEVVVAAEPATPSVPAASSVTKEVVEVVVAGRAAIPVDIPVEPPADTQLEVPAETPIESPVEATILPSAAPEPVTAKRTPEEDEAAAMRAIEGNWSPRQKTGKPRRSAPAPDGISDARDAVKASGAAVAAAAEATSAVVEALPDPNKPAGITAPRNGRPDELTNVIGILPIIETALNTLGIYHFDQVAELNEKQTAWLEAHLGIDGRISREHWREQAVELAALTKVKVAAET